MTAATFSTDGSVLAVAVEKVITLWDPWKNILVAVIGETIEVIFYLELLCCIRFSFALTSLFLHFCHVKFLTPLCSQSQPCHLWVNQTTLCRLLEDQIRNCPFGACQSCQSHGHTSFMLKVFIVLSLFSRNLSYHNPVFKLLLKIYVVLFMQYLVCLWSYKLCIGWFLFGCSRPSPYIVYKYGFYWIHHEGCRWSYFII